ncbi:hypothetical protein K438DRAFT_1854475 [Mycena galopus ATCC 62051]|nr:hypothetical protein K438DRAFT_1854475 [Mycena galopus ATCC 62051]
MPFLFFLPHMSSTRMSYLRPALRARILPTWSISHIPPDLSPALDVQTQIGRTSYTIQPV